MTGFRALSLSRRAALALGAATLSLGLGACSQSAEEPAAAVAEGAAEKPDLTLGFIKLTDMAPLAIAKEEGFFEEEGLNVTLVPQANWKVLMDGVIAGDLDAAHMLAGQPIAASAGVGAQADLIAPMSLDLNGNAITVSNEVWAAMSPALPKGADGKVTHPISAAALRPAMAGDTLKFGMVFPVSPHNYELRYWLAAGGINPGFYLPGDAAGTTGAQVQLSVTPPPQMPSTLEAGTIDGYSVGEPWNQAAVDKAIGVPVITDAEIFPDNPEKVLGMTAAFAEANPVTTRKLIRAIIKAQAWLDADDGANRAEAVEILSRSEYVGAQADVIAASMTGTFTFGPGDTRPAPGFNTFFDRHAGYPFYSDAVWFLTQMRRWGQIAEDKTDQWYLDTAKDVYRPELYLGAAQSLVEEGVITEDALPETDGFRATQTEFIDGVAFDGHTPNAYLAGFRIGLKQGDRVTPAGVSAGAAK